MIQCPLGLANLGLATYIGFSDLNRVDENWWLNSAGTLLQVLYFFFRKRFQEAEKAVKEAKKAEETAKQNWSSKEAEEDTIKMEITSLQKSVETAENQLGTNDEAIQGLAEEAEKLKEKLRYGQHQFVYNFYFSQKQGKKVFKSYCLPI